MALFGLKMKIYLHFSFEASAGAENKRNCKEEVNVQHLSRDGV
jgi:hypothetical protein